MNDTEQAPLEFEALYHGHVAFVWRYAATHGVPAAQLDDVVQEVFLVVHGRLQAFEHRSSAKTWIAGIAVNVVRGYLRKRRHRTLGDSLSDREEPPGTDRSAAETLDLKRSVEQLDALVARMTELQREAFILCELEELPQIDVARLLDINENTLRARLRSARQLLAEALKSGNPSPTAAGSP